VKDDIKAELVKAIAADQEKRSALQAAEA
jgi:hypothetical protein